MTKACTKCAEDKLLTEYYVKREHGRERYASHCKACHRAVTGRWQAANREKVRSLRRGYDVGNEKRFVQVREWQRANREKVRAHSAVANALRDGRIVRPAQCEACGCDPGQGHDGRALLEAHHEDYAAPLAVRWLCSSCHHRDHAGQVVQVRHYPPKAKGTGKNATSWNGTRDRAIQARFRRYLLARDGPSCQACGATDKPLEAHHDTPSDGRMLCRPCHKEADPHAR